MSILNLTSEELVKYVEKEFKEVKDSDFENGDNAYHQKTTTAHLAQIVATFEPATHDSSAGNRRCYMRIGNHGRVSCLDGLATDGCNRIEDGIIEATHTKTELLDMLDESCLVVIDDDCDWRSHEIIMYRRNPGSDDWVSTVVERHY
mgnify:FL=1